MQVVILTLIFFMMYQVVLLAFKNNIPSRLYKYMVEKNERYFDAILKKYDKDKKSLNEKNRKNILYKINNLLERASVKPGLIVNPITILLLGVVCYFAFYGFIFSEVKIVMLSLIISIPTLFLPIFIISIIASTCERRIENTILNFLLQLKNYTKINNDIIYAFNQIKVQNPLQSYVNTFLIEVNSGIRFEDAIENFKDKITFENIKMFLSNLKYCYLYGGSFCELIDKSYLNISQMQQEKNKRIQETRSARLILFILIGINILVYISFIKNNKSNYMIMTNTTVGNIILYWNFISMWFLLYLAQKMKKLDY